MTEEIIVDGVNVAGCKYFVPVHTEDDADIEISNCCVLTYTPCQYEKKNCYYKQLKRLEQENAMLKNERTADLVRQIDELKAENERLKEDIMQAHKDWEEKKNLAYELACKNERLKKHWKK